MVVGATVEHEQLREKLVVMAFVGETGGWCGGGQQAMTERDQRSCEREGEQIRRERERVALFCPFIYSFKFIRTFGGLKSICHCLAHFSKISSKWNNTESTFCVCLCVACFTQCNYFQILSMSYVPIAVV